MGSKTGADSPAKSRRNTPEPDTTPSRARDRWCRLASIHTNFLLKRLNRPLDLACLQPWGKGCRGFATLVRRCYVQQRYPDQPSDSSQCQHGPSPLGSLGGTDGVNAKFISKSRRQRHQAEFGCQESCSCGHDCHSVVVGRSILCGRLAKPPRGGFRKLPKNCETARFQPLGCAWT